MHPTAHDLLVHMRDDVVDAQTGLIRRSLMIDVNDEMLNRVEVARPIIHLNGSQREAKASLTSRYKYGLILLRSTNQMMNGRLVALVLVPRRSTRRRKVAKALMIHQAANARIAAARRHLIVARYIQVFCCCRCCC